MKKRTRKLIAGVLSFILCLSLNASPIAVIAGAIVETGVVDRFVNLKNNLIWVSENGGVKKRVYADDTPPSIEVKLNVTPVVSAIDGIKGGATLEDINNTIQSTTEKINSNIDTDTTMINGSIETCQTHLENVNTKLQDIHSTLGDIEDAIKAQSHNYKVAHLYSLNNSLNGVRWRPYTKDVDYVDDIAMVSGPFANVYTGYWDSAVTTLTNTSDGLGDNVHTSRALEVLGYDATIRSEGIVLLANAATKGTPTGGGSGQNQMYTIGAGIKPSQEVVISTLFQEKVPEEDICWIDAVTLLYKALGQEQVTYQSFMSKNNNITPENSPAFQNLANPVKGSDGNYNGYDYYMFLTRGNVLTAEQSMNGDKEPKMDMTANYIYWQKALNGGFIPAGNEKEATEPITFSEFYILASKMMQAYGEPVMNDSELKALLQVYGTHYPIQLGEEIADSWAYLAARGILDMSEYTEGAESILYNVNNTGYITRDQLLLMCMRIKDKESRTDYKKIDIVLDLSDVMQEDYYYPVYDLDVAKNGFSASITYDHAKSKYYDYLIACKDSYSLGDSGVLTLYSDKDCTTVISDGVCKGVIEAAGEKWYHVRLPKDFTNNAYLAKHLESGTSTDAKVDCIEIPSTALGGGYYTSVSDGDNVAIVSNSGIKPFNYNSNSKVASFTDWERAGEEKPKGTESASNATILERVALIIDTWTTPMRVFAAEDNESDDVQADFKITIEDENKNAQQSYDSTVQFNPEGNLTWDSIAKRQFDDDSDGGSYPLFNEGEQQIRLVNRNRVSARRLQKLVNCTEFLLYNKGDFGNINLKDLLVDGSIKNGILSYLGDEPKGAWEESISKKDIEFCYGTQYMKRNRDFTVSCMIFDVPAMTQSIHDDEGNYSYTCAEHSKVSTFNEWRKTITNKYFSDEDDSIISGWINEGLKWLVTGRDTSPGISPDDGNDTGPNLSNVPNHPDINPDDGRYIFGGNPETTKKIFNEIANDKTNSSFISGSSPQGTTNPNPQLSNTPLDENSFTTTVMSKKQNILISWTDIVESGFVNETKKDEKPKPKENGAYEFMCEEGRVIVNDLWHTIQIGTMLYDLTDSNDGKSPKLVYVDTDQKTNESELYFDYRCVMGICDKEFIPKGDKTVVNKNAIGSGDTVIYTLNSSGSDNVTIYESKEIMSYNYPETPDRTCVSSSRGFKVKLLTETRFDGDKIPESLNDVKKPGESTDTQNAEGQEEQPSTDDTTKEKYWPDKSKVSRLKLASNVPTANWICVIRDEGGSNVSGNLYVYYPRTAFQDGFVEVDGSFTQLEEPANFKDNAVYKNEAIKQVLNEAVTIKNGDTNISSLLQQVYNVDTNDLSKEPWYIKMSCEAIAQLYIDTGGLYYISEDFVVRRFDISKNSLSEIHTWCDIGKDTIKTSNATGAIYYMDQVGYIYNMPKVAGSGEDGFTLEKYLSGEYPLPVAMDTGNNPHIVNYNINYYGAPINGETKEIQKINDGSAKWLPYGVVLNPGKSGENVLENPYINLSGGKYDVGCNAPDNDSEYLPFNNKKDDVNSKKPDDKSYYVQPKFFIAAPVGIYTKFQNGGVIEKMTVSNINKWITASTQVYLGSSLLSFDSTSSSEKLFQFVSESYARSKVNNNTVVYRVHRARNGKDTLIIDSGNILHSNGAGTYNVNLDDVYTNPLEDWLKGLGTTDLITAIDNGASWLILIAFRVLPMIGIILMTILVGLSFVCDIKFVQLIFEKTIDPVKILTFGGRDMYTWHWKRVLFPCILLYVVFALFLNGNLIRIIMWATKWYGVIMQWAKTL